ncbi:MAG: Xaa-Pro peptidase family protein [Acidobacteriia bacterium]|nr:Xaa-Pro peptidase family protein [Terriglobia bacterium]
MNYAARQKRLAAQLQNAGVDALFLTHLPNIRYLCGFSGSAGILVFRGGTGSASPRAVFYTDGRYRQQASEEIQGAKVVIGRKPAFVAACESLLRAGVRQVGFEAGYLPYEGYRQMVRILRGRTKLKPVSGTVEELRAIKDSKEIEQMRAAALLGCSLFQTALTAIAPGVPESEVAGEMELQARRAGAEKMSFDTIVAAGGRSALPHGRASSAAIPAGGFVILDYGVILAGYCSDMTRTVHVGKAPSERRRMYEAVRAAQMASIQAVKPGVTAGEVDQAGRQVLKKAGYGAWFTHSTGHGVGIEIHEQPRLARGQTQKLAPGMVVTIEPGIYIPEQGGVRIEDMVLVTESGNEVLTPTTRELIEL